MQPLLNERQAAELMSLSVRSLQRLRQSGLGPPYVKLPGGSVRYLPAMTERWLAARVVTSTSAPRADQDRR
jgi:predicted DNA-binding transcriptional regulator AlpA